MIEITQKNLLKNKNDVYITGLYPMIGGILLVKATWCGHCTRFLPDFKRLDSILGSNYKVAMIDDKNLGNFKEILNIKGYPTLLFFDKEGKINNSFPDTMKRDINNILKYICSIQNHCKTQAF
jgi:thiol-disulfide isomerase/thioredoxin